MNKLDDRKTVKTVKMRAADIQAGDVIQNPGSGKWYEVVEVKDTTPGRVALVLSGQHGLVPGGPWRIMAYDAVTVQVLV